MVPSFHFPGQEHQQKPVVLTAVATGRAPAAKPTMTHEQQQAQKQVRVTALQLAQKQLPDTATTAELLFQAAAIERYILTGARTEDVVASGSTATRKQEPCG